MAIQKIAILGAGNGGCAAAADLTLRGFEVRLYSRSQERLRPILERGGIDLLDGGRENFAVPSRVTSDIAETVGNADWIIIAAPSLAHEYLGTKLAPHLRDGDKILLNPGHTGGSLHLAGILRRAGSKAKVGICETVTLTYICRMKSQTKVEIYRRTTHLRCAAFPGKLTSGMVGQIKDIFPNVVAARDVMETGLSNINAIMHPAGMLTNAGWIEKTQGDFCFYREGVTPAVAEIIEAVDNERIGIVKRLGLPPVSFVEIFYQAGLTSQEACASGSVYRAISESEPNRTIKSPSTLDHRYLKEDVGYGLVPMAAIGRLLGVGTSVIDALITLASRVGKIDYQTEGLTLEKMGLSGKGEADLLSILQDGFES